ncbi:MAG: hypothetical protein O3B13_25420 [Planctomycetota bacterium]|nr:hypothetical protein [Planctomycetota bacterium]
MNHAQNQGRQVPPGEQWTWRMDGRGVHEEPENEDGRDSGSGRVPYPPYGVVVTKDGGCEDVD